MSPWRQGSGHPTEIDTMISTYRALSGGITHINPCHCLTSMTHCLGEEPTMQQLIISLTNSMKHYVDEQVAQGRAINGAGQPQSAHASHCMRRLCLPLSSALLCAGHFSEIVRPRDIEREFESCHSSHQPLQVITVQFGQQGFTLRVLCMGSLSQPSCAPITRRTSSHLRCRTAKPLRGFAAAVLCVRHSPPLRSHGNH